MVCFYMDFRVCMWYTMPSGVLRQGLLCSPEWPGTHYVDHTGLELICLCLLLSARITRHVTACLPHTLFI